MASGPSVAVIGGGIAGLVCAARLGQLGINNVRVFDTGTEMFEVFDKTNIHVCTWVVQIIVCGCSLYLCQPLVLLLLEIANIIWFVLSKVYTYEGGIK